MEFLDNVQALMTRMLRTSAAALTALAIVWPLSARTAETFVPDEAARAYVAQLQLRIETAASDSWPQADGRHIYGNLELQLRVRANGEVVETSVRRSSGNPELDRQAQEIVRRASPFEVFPDTLKAAVDELVVVRHFNFGRYDDEDQPWPTGADCPPRVLDGEPGMAALREAASLCPQDRATYAAVLKRLQQVAPASKLKVAQTLIVDGPIQGVTLETAVYFDAFDAWLPDLTLPRLDDLAVRMGRMFDVQRLLLTARTNRIEDATANGDLLARHRAEQVLRYLQSTGIDLRAVRIETVSAAATHADTVEGRARDRVVEIRVIGRRNP